MNLPAKPPEKNALTVARSVGSYPVSTVKAGDLRYARDMHQAMIAERTGTYGILVGVAVVMLVVFLIWAATSRVEEITRANAKIIPSSHEQVIQSLEGGLVSEMLVKEGDVVESGQPLIKIDPVKATSIFKEGLSKSLALQAAAARLRAESNGTALKFPREVREVPDLVENETANYKSRRNALDQSVAALRTNLALAQKELSMLEPMAEKGLIAEVEVLRIRRQLNELALQIQDRINRYRVEAAGELVKVESELAQSNENLTAREDQVRRTTINAPLRGTVKNIRINTIGGVLQPGQDIMEIVPLEDKLLVEARVLPSDVAFLRPGLPATLKITAYDYAIYGALDATIELISADTVKDDQRRGPASDESYFRVLLRTKQASLSAGGKQLPIIPGMTGVVEIRTGEKTVMDYLLKPVLKVKEALRER